MNHLLDANVATKLLELKGYRAVREPMGFTVYDKDEKIVARTAVDVSGLIARHAIKHLL